MQREEEFEKKGGNYSSLEISESTLKQDQRNQKEK